jgi:transcriptional regulator with XRE-family HTH domain
MQDTSEHIKYAEIARALKAARQRKGMSQQALGERVGLPQSHISKIESGTVDVKLSSLIELARALEMEFVLLPRQLLGVVESLQRGASESELYTRLEIETTDALKKLGDTVSQLRRRYERSDPDGADELKALDSAAHELARQFVPQQYAQEVRHILTTLNNPLRALRNLQELESDIGHAANYRTNLNEQFSAIRPLRLRLQQIRNAAVHGAHERASPQMPAYRLDEEDDNA